jgi:hypothetical protein
VVLLIAFNFLEMSINTYGSNTMESLAGSGAMYFMSTIARTHQIIMEIQGFTLKTTEDFPYSGHPGSGCEDGETRFIVKEIAWMSTDSRLMKHALVRPPYEKRMLSAKDRCSAEWLTRKYHGLAWESGHVTYDELYIMLSELARTITKQYPNSFIITKGEEKVRWLRGLLRDIGYIENGRLIVANAELLSAPPFPTLKAEYIAEDRIFSSKRICAYHFNASSSNCALANCFLLKTWFLRNSDRLDLNGAMEKLRDFDAPSCSLSEYDLNALPTTMFLMSTPTPSLLSDEMLLEIWSKLPERVRTNLEVKNRALRATMKQNNEDNMCE